MPQKIKNKIKGMEKIKNYFLPFPNLLVQWSTNFLAMFDLAK
jgi:hypothetical protein